MSMKVVSIGPPGGDFVRVGPINGYVGFAGELAVVTGKVVGA